VCNPHTFFLPFFLCLKPNEIYDNDSTGIYFNLRTIKYLVPTTSFESGIHFNDQSRLFGSCSRNLKWADGVFFVSNMRPGSLGNLWSVRQSNKIKSHLEEDLVFGPSGQGPMANYAETELNVPSEITTPVGAANNFKSDTHTHTPSTRTRTHKHVRPRTSPTPHLYIFLLPF